MNTTTKRNIKEALKTRIEQMRTDLSADLSRTVPISQQGGGDSHFWRWRNGQAEGSARTHFQKQDETEDVVRKYITHLQNRCQQIEDLVAASKEVEKLVPDDQPQSETIG